jgi:hypothetical protein
MKRAATAIAPVITAASICVRDRTLYGLVHDLRCLRRLGYLLRKFDPIEERIAPDRAHLLNDSAALCRRTTR